VVTVRTYLNVFQAQLAKSLLDDYEIFCVLWDENAHIIRAPFAIPVRLAVADAHAEAATLILHDNVEGLAQYLEHFSDRELIGSDTVELIEWPAENANPWELLVAAYYFFVPGVIFLQIRYPSLPKSTSFISYLIARVTVAHFLGWIAIIFAASLIAAYFHTWRREPEVTQVSDVNPSQPSR